MHRHGAGCHFWKNLCIALLLLLMYNMFRNKFQEETNETHTKIFVRRRFDFRFHAVTLTGCAAAEEPHPPAADEGIVAPSEPEQPLPDQPVDVPADTPDKGPADVPAVEEPQAELVMYIKVTGDGVNIRGGPGSNYNVLGTAQKNTLYASDGRHGNWYKTYYKGMEAYIYKDYCILVEFEAAEEEVEAVIAEGTRHMGVKYVYGATRYHNGRGVRLSGFTAQAFDCSSLMQYIFKIAADVNLQMTTRTQVVQGVTVKDKLKRGDLMFFTNAARKNKTGVERIGHVAMYLGDNYILHTASDYAKIEQISSTRWSYYIQAQRMI